MPTLSQFEEVMRRLLQQEGRKQVWQSVVMTIMSLALGWLLSDIFPPVVMMHLMHGGVA